MNKLKFPLCQCVKSLCLFLLFGASANAAPMAAAVVDDGYASKVMEKILKTGKLKFGQKMDLRLSLDDQGHLLECRASKGGDAQAACAAAKAASPFGTPPYGVPTYVTLALWTGQPPSKTQEKKQPTENASAETKVSPAAWIANVRRTLRNSIYIPEKTKPGTYHVTAQISYDQAGKILDSSIVKSSGDKLLDKYCLQGIKRAGQIPPPPAGTGMTTDVTFTLTRR